MRALITSRCLFDHNRQPIPFGKKMLVTLSQSWSITILTEGANHTRQDLLTHHIDDSDITVVEIDHTKSYPDNVTIARTQTRIDVLIDSDPMLMTWAYSQGLPGLLVLEPKFMDPRFRPDGPGFAPWSQLVDEMESQTRMLAAKREEWKKSGDIAWD